MPILKKREVISKVIQFPSIHNHAPYLGDIILFPDQARAIYEGAYARGRRRHKRKFIGPQLRRWDTSQPIDFSFDGSHS